MTVIFEVLGERPLARLDTTPFHQWVFSDGTLWTAFHRTEAGYLLRFPELADFQLDWSGTRVQAWAAPGVSEATLQHLYLNQVLPLALSKQGKLVLHGSAVEIGDKSVAFIGKSGRGKSTLAASFATSGFRFLTDDGLLLDWLNGDCRVMPSHPSIRLWEDSQNALVGEDVQFAPPLQFTNKARFLAGRDIVFCHEARPLRKVYFLGEGLAPQLQLERMKPVDALVELIKNSFLLDIDEREMLASHFDAVFRLAALPIYYRLDYPRNYEDLPSVRNAIARHVSEESEMT